MAYLDQSRGRADGIIDDNPATESRKQNGVNASLKRMRSAPNQEKRLKLVEKGAHFAEEISTDPKKARRSTRSR